MGLLKNEIELVAFVDTNKNMLEPRYTDMMTGIVEQVRNDQAISGKQFHAIEVSVGVILQKMKEDLRSRTKCYPQ